MDKETFKALFEKIVNEAILQAQKASLKYIPSQHVIEMHGAGVSGKILSSDEALDAMFIDDSLFYRVIDVGVKSVSSDVTVLFIRISEHEPVKFNETWNTPKGNGPFKVIIPTRL